MGLLKRCFYVGAASCVAAGFILPTASVVAQEAGLVPVVGVPLPLISYGGTAMLSVMVGFGFLLSAFVHRDLRISRHGTREPE